MPSSVLKSKKRIAAIMRAFVMLRQHLTDYDNLKEQIQQLKEEMNVKFMVETNGKLVLLS